MAFPWLKTGEGPPNKGRAMSDERRAQMSVAMRARRDSGWKPANTGKEMTYTPEHLAKLRENLKAAVAARKRLAPGDIGAPSHGYVMVLTPDHPRANSSGYVSQHRLIGEKVLGRYMTSDEVVHHINGDKSDNRHTNLLICDQKYHRELHQRMGRLYQHAMFGRKGD